MNVPPRLMLVMALLPITLIMLMTLSGAVSSSQLYVASAHFVPVSATVEYRKDFTSVDITYDRPKRVCMYKYAYKFGNQQYTSTRVPIGHDDVCPWIAQLPAEGQRVTALVDPQSPEVSLIIRTFPSFALVAAAIMGALWLGLVFLLFRSKS